MYCCYTPCLFWPTHHQSHHVAAWPPCLSLRFKNSLFSHTTWIMLGMLRTFSNSFRPYRCSYRLFDVTPPPLKKSDLAHVSVNTSAKKFLASGGPFLFYRFNLKNLAKLHFEGDILIVFTFINQYDLHHPFVLYVSLNCLRLENR